MLSCSARRWPQGGEWVLQPKWDGFRLLVEVGEDRRVRGWSRHGTNLTARLAALTAAFADAPPGSVFDGELVAISEQRGRPVQDFAAVCRAVLRGDASAAEDLRFVGFDLLALGGEDLRSGPWSDPGFGYTKRAAASGLIRRVESLPANRAAHAAILALGFEGTVLKRPKSTYRPGRQRVWLKHKARYTADGVLLSVRRDRDGQWHGVCDVDGRRVSVLAGARSADQVGEVLTLVYSRVDADGGLREVRIAGPAKRRCRSQAAAPPPRRWQRWLSPRPRPPGAGGAPRRRSPRSRCTHIDLEQAPGWPPLIKPSPQRTLEAASPARLARREPLVDYAREHSLSWASEPRAARGPPGAHCLGLRGTGLPAPRGGTTSADVGPAIPPARAPGQDDVS